MKRMFFSGVAVAIAVTFGLVNTASAQQYGSNHQYSSYGYRVQEAADDKVPTVKEAVENMQDAVQTQSPSDEPVPVPVPSNTAGPVVNSAPQSYGAGCNNGGGGYYAPANGSYAAGSGCDGGGASYGNSGYAVGNGAYSGGNYGGGGCGVGGGIGGGYGLGAGGCGAGAGIGQDLIRSNDRNMVFGVRGLLFERDYEDDRGLGSNAAGDFLFTTDSNDGTFSGFETTLGSRGCNGSGWEIGYWGLYPELSDTTFSGGPFTTTLTGLSAVDLGGNSVQTILNTSDSWRLYRQTEIHNLEFNMLRNAGSVRGLFGGTSNIEWTAGVRWFKFSENMRLAASNSTAGYPPVTFYDLDVENNLLGFQVGASSERCLSSRTTVSLGTKFGIYNNDIYHRQSIYGGGALATVPSGPVDYSFSARKDDIATMGELDLGLNYQFSQQWRANVGYRAIGVTSIALVADQIPYNFNDTEEIQRIKSNGSLLLHGAYFGVERSF